MKLLAIAMLAQAAMPIPQPAPNPQDPLVTGATFLSHCTKALDGSSSGEVFGICFGYLDGLIDRDDFAPHLFCIPGSISKGEVMSAVLNQLRADPGLSKISVGVAVPTALNKAFPAEGKPRGQCTT